MKYQKRKQETIPFKNHIKRSEIPRNKLNRRGVRPILYPQNSKTLVKLKGKDILCSRGMLKYTQDLKQCPSLKRMKFCHL